ncbi:MAG: hypothetical protein L0332_08515 [Chloroflexi bacterium]|nr:hypothetical protein [Chloroflexota bacterium]MCI0576356.1 hypothetical protein [Chloroflexota bacterium]MCI0646189.1 hypothetical protein [Chloroflexota bacterium]MCI0726749.1 hypothetical protein [Chloroflexota bacterium]
MNRVPIFSVLLIILVLFALAACTDDGNVIIQGSSGELTLPTDTPTPTRTPTATTVVLDNAATATALFGTQVAAAQTAAFNMAATETVQTATAAAATATRIAQGFSENIQFASIKIVKPESDGYDCVTGLMLDAAATPPEANIQNAVFTSDQNNVIFQVGFEPGLDLAAAVGSRNEPWQIFVGINDPQYPLPLDDPAVYGDNFQNLSFNFIWSGNTGLVLRMMSQLRDGQWTTTQDPPGVAGQFGGYTATLTIPTSVLPEEGTLYVNISSGSTVCNNAGAAEQGPAIGFRKSDEQPPFSILWDQDSLLAATSTPSATPTSAP